MQMPKNERRTNTGDARPFVSVVIPIYNGSKYIVETLDSVFAQTFSRYEVIVVNDGSPDTPELERVLNPYRTRIVYIEQENGGPASARNTAIRQAVGDYIAFLDQDDVWMPEYLSKQVKVLQNDPSITLVCADAYLCGDTVSTGRTFFQDWPSQEPVTFEKLLEENCAVVLMCVVARKQPLLEAGLLDPDRTIMGSDDYDLWLRLAIRGERFVYQYEALGYHRIHGESLGADEIRLLLGQVNVYEKLLHTLVLPPATQRLIKKQMARVSAGISLRKGKRQIAAGEFSDAVRTLSRANKYYRRRKLQLVVLGLRFAPRLARYFYGVYSRRVFEVPHSEL